MPATSPAADLDQGARWRANGTWRQPRPENNDRTALSNRGLSLPIVLLVVNGFGILFDAGHMEPAVVIAAPEQDARGMLQALAAIWSCKTRGRWR
jgi:hypothetical protein